MPYTLSYDEKVNGWVSFFSFYPEMMVNLNNDLFSFSDGQLYIHNQETGDRNSFYGEPSASTTVEVLFNDSPSDIKTFKTIEIEGDTSAWDVTVATDLEEGHILKESFKTKEGRFYEYIKRNEDDILNFKALSIQGIGELEIFQSGQFQFTSVPNNINVGDKLYVNSIPAPELVGTITAVGSNYIEVDTVLVSPAAGSFMFAGKSPVAESTGLKGYYASVTLTNTQTDPVELFAVNTEIVKSFP